MSEYYAVVRSTDHLAHYGVKGMKWGVRKAQMKGNQRALDRHFRRAARKLKKLQDIGLKPAKYAAKSAAYGAAAAATGTIAIAGTKGYSNYLRNKAKSLASAARSTEMGLKGYVNLNKDGNAELYTTAARKLNRQSKDLHAKADSVDRWGSYRKEVPVYKENLKEMYAYDDNGKKYVVKRKVERVQDGTQQVGLSRNDKLRIGAGAATLGLGALSAVNAYRAKNYKKYRQKAVDFKTAMDSAFAGTKYEGKYVSEPRRRRKRRKS